MIKKVLFIISMMAMPFACIADDVVGKLIALQINYIDPYAGVPQGPRSPLDPPTVYIEDYTLTFEADHQEFILYIKDENQVVVYNTMVGETDTEVVLPSTLSGTYEIDLVTDDYYFWGYIEL